MTDEINNDGGVEDLLNEIEQVQLDDEVVEVSPDFEDLTLGEVLGLAFRAPFRTFGALMNVLQTPINLKPHDVDLPIVAQKSRKTSTFWLNVAMFGLLAIHAFGVGLGLLLTFQSTDDLLGLVFFITLTVSVFVLTLTGVKSLLEPQANERFKVIIPDILRRWLVLMIWLAAFVIGVRGGFVMLQGEIRTEPNQLYKGTPYIIVTFLLMFYSLYWRSVVDIDPAENEELPEESASSWVVHPVRIFAGIGTIFLSLLAFFESINNQFTTLGFWSWTASVILVVATFAPTEWLNLPVRGWLWLVTYRDRQREALKQPFKVNWTLIFLILIMLVAALFRMYDLDGMPPQMTSDHKEKLLDAQRVVDGDRDIFFMNNGGREAFQMYALAVMHTVLGMELNHLTLKILAVFESLITIPALWWMARQIVGEKDRQLGNLIGLILAGLIAVSYWHVAITRLALRIILTPFIASLLMAFLARGIRHNRRQDYIIAGLILGYGLYTYQAARMLPIVVLASVALAILWHWRSRIMARRYIGNLAVLVIVSFVIFIPLFRFSIQYPDSFWMRSAGRLFGDDVIQTEDEYGRLVFRDATIEERLSAFGDNLPALAENIRGALLMFNWKGDVGWISGLPLHPEMDPFSSTLLIMGTVGVFLLFIRKRDPIYLLIPLTVFIMLLPSALSIALTIENPSATRASGSIPAAYFLAALPLTYAVIVIRRSIRWRALAVVPPIAVMLLSFNYNTNIYFNDYREAYRHSTWPYSIPGDVLRGFVLSDGAYGNAFMIGYSNWWDYTIVGMEGGMMAWQNGIVSMPDVPNRMNDLAYCSQVVHRFDPRRDMLFFYHFDDIHAEDQLSAWFPDGYAHRVVTYYEPYDFKIFRVPALGEAEFREFVDTYATGRTCPPPPAAG